MTSLFERLKDVECPEDTSFGTPAIRQLGTPFIGRGMTVPQLWYPHSQPYAYPFHGEWTMCDPLYSPQMRRTLLAGAIGKLLGVYEIDDYLPTHLVPCGRYVHTFRDQRHSPDVGDGQTTIYFEPSSAMSEVMTKLLLANLTPKKPKVKYPPFTARAKDVFEANLAKRIIRNKI